MTHNTNTVDCPSCGTTCQPPINGLVYCWQCETEYDAPKKWFNYLSPDGITIYPHDWDSEAQANAALDRWVERFEKQGYYSSNAGRITLADLKAKCKLVTFE